MKLVSSLFLLAAVILSTTGCDNLVTRRSLYSPARGSGPWTKKFEDQRRDEGIFGISNSHHRGKPPGE